MESRYALREIEGAIGYDCRRLEGGRRALFRHTFLHRAVRRSFRDRRDMINVLGMSYVAMSGFASNMKLNVDSSIQVVGDTRLTLLKTAFPYLNFETESKEKSYEDYSEYFDELDAIEAAKAAGSVGDDGSK